MKCFLNNCRAFKLKISTAVNCQSQAPTKFQHIFRWFQCLPIVWFGTNTKRKWGLPSATWTRTKPHTLSCATTCSCRVSSPTRGVHGLLLQPHIVLMTQYNAICFLLFSICYLLFAICFLLFALCYLLLAFCYLLFAICDLLIAFRHLNLFNQITH